ncbi:unnamed protein product [Vicia faba]|uniref:Uncharacterized protein n=1 Tax=Vicia faba TaxID=3906 RepID=A0AAV1AX69_VICFA|nr:unnamed protein product [Vicia faba]
MYVVFLAKVVPLHLNLFFIKHWTLACHMLVDFCIDILNQNKVEAQTVMFHIGYKYLQVGWKFVSINHHVFRGIWTVKAVARLSRTSFEPYDKMCHYLSHDFFGFYLQNLQLDQQLEHQNLQFAVAVVLSCGSIWTVKAVTRLSYHGHPLSLKIKQLYVVFLAKVVPLCLNLFFIKHWTLACYMFPDFCIDILNQNKVEAQTVMFHIGYKYLQIGWKFVSINHHVFRGPAIVGVLQECEYEAYEVLNYILLLREVEEFWTNMVWHSIVWGKPISRCMEQFAILDYNG